MWLDGASSAELANDRQLRDPSQIRDTLRYAVQRGHPSSRGLSGSI